MFISPGEMRHLVDAVVDTATLMEAIVDLLPEEARVHCHGQGYATVERPIASEAETLAFGPDMNVGIHPSIATDRMFVTICDNFLTRSDGSIERLHDTPQEIIEI